MPKITDEDLEAVLVRLFKSDLDYLRTIYRGSFGVNKAIRNIVRSFVTHMKASAADNIDREESKTHAGVDLL